MDLSKQLDLKEVYFLSKDQNGEYPFVFSGKAGILEGILTRPVAQKYPYVAILGHPHSLQGGTMNNKVVTTMGRAFREIGIPSLRFNFRGVGRSEGRFDYGNGESDDLLSLAEALTNISSDNQFLLGGFSFGAYVTYRAAIQLPHQLLLSVAPPVNHFNFNVHAETSLSSWHILHGDMDDVVDLQMVLSFANAFIPPLPVHCFEKTGHFFHGHLLQLKTKLLELIEAAVRL